MTDDKVDKTLEQQENFEEVARSKDIEVCVDPDLQLLPVTVTHPHISTADATLFYKSMIRMKNVTALRRHSGLVSVHRSSRRREVLTATSTEDLTRVNSVT